MLETAIRKIAKSHEYQFLYKKAEDITLNLFKNFSDYSKLQLMFLQWLEVYKVLYMDLAKQEKYISEEVIKDDIRADAYLLYRSKYKNIDNEKQQDKGKILTGVPSVSFKRK